MKKPKCPSPWAVRVRIRGQWDTRGMSCSRGGAKAIADYLKKEHRGQIKVVKASKAEMEFMEFLKKFKK